MTAAKLKNNLQVVFFHRSQSNSPHVKFGLRAVINVILCIEYITIIA